ncbi:MAG: hypothetical protein AAGL18_09380 [Pseudomonadota bacterium]
MDTKKKRLARLEGQITVFQDLIDAILKDALEQSAESDVRDKTVRMLSPAMSAMATASTIEEKLTSTIELAEARLADRAGTAQDDHIDDSRSRNEPSLDRILEETARYAHAYLAATDVQDPPNADAPKDRTLC